MLDLCRGDRCFLSHPAPQGNRRHSAYQWATVWHTHTHRHKYAYVNTEKSQTYPNTCTCSVAYATYRVGYIKDVIFMIINCMRVIPTSSWFVWLALKQIDEHGFPSSGSQADVILCLNIWPVMEGHSTPLYHGRHAHSHKSTRAWWYIQTYGGKHSICTQADTYTGYKSDSCRHDGALGEEEVKA